jgi:hypothetical protein
MHASDRRNPAIKASATSSGFVTFATRSYRRTVPAGIGA